MGTAVKRLTIGLLGVLVVWTLLGLGCSLYERPPTLHPLRVGMTIAEVAEARPGRYRAYPVFRDCPKATILTRAEQHRFIGDIAVRLPNGQMETLSFAGGMHTGPTDGPKPVSELSHLTPGRTALGTTLKRLPRGADARIVSGREPWRDLPEEAARFTRYSGRLLSGTSWGLLGMNETWWDLEVRDGRITEIKEKHYED